MKTSNKSSISALVKICAEKGLKHVVISPGSRNAPLILSFAENDAFDCLNIPDERVAGFYALGIAQKTQQPVILCCTSGTALLNYAPAIAEAYYQRIPLLILSADRPLEWIDQRAGQTMKQRDVFVNYIKQSFELIEEAVQPEHLWYNDRITNEAINACTGDNHGPVHLNVPMRQPLYELIPAEQISTPKIIQTTPYHRLLDTTTFEQLNQEWERYPKKLVVVGQHRPSQAFTEVIEKMARRTDTVVLTETTSNVIADHVFPSIDRVIDSIGEFEYADFKPDLILSCGASIVSKKIRFMLRQMAVPGHWHIALDDGHVDTYQSLTRLIPVQPEYLLEHIASFPEDKNAIDYKERWLIREVRTKKAHDQFVNEAVWSDLHIMKRLFEAIPSGSIQLASSTPIRYSQLFDPRKDCSYWCNRGVSGIDGCTSTAAGYAYQSDDIVTLITGDLAFFYDSNALWHHHLPSNLRIIVMNNEGGNIFRYVKGPDTTNHLEKHFEASHQTNARGIAASFGVDYYNSDDWQSLEKGLLSLFHPNQVRPAILEVHTPREQNIPILKEYFDFLRKESH